MRIGSSLFTALVMIALATGACGGSNDDPDGAKQLFAKVNEGAGFTTWERAPGYPGRRQSFTSHGDEVEIFVNPTITQALAGPTSITQWPVGSIIVKEGFSGNARSLVAIMEKRDRGWYWAEYNGDGDPLYSGKPSTCTDCHKSRTSYSDWVFAFEFPK